MSSDWIIQPAKHGGHDYDELFYPGEFLPCWDEMYGNDTEADSRSGYPYWFVPDELKCKYFDYRDNDFNRNRLDKYADHVAYKRPCIEISELSHFTNRDNFDSIEDEGFLRASPKYMNGILTGSGYEEDFSFVWFTATVDEEDQKMVRQSIWDRHREIRHFLHYQVGYEYQRDFMRNGDNYATSTPFTKYHHPCGEHVFSFSIADLFYNYRKRFRNWHGGSPFGGCRIRRLGTFVYKKEVMYAVVVHPTSFLNWNESKFFNTLPSIDETDDDDATPVYLDDNGSFYWKPFSTSSKFSGTTKPIYCRWDQLAFAFYFPKSYAGRDRGFNLDEMTYFTC